MYTHTHIHVTEKEIYPVTLVSTTTLTFHDTLPLLEKRNHIFKIRFPPDSTWRKERKFRKGKKKGEGRFYRIIVRSYPFFHARWIRRDSAIPWTNGEFSTRGWKRRVNRTRYFVAWNNNEAGWPQCVCNGCSVISRLPGIHLPPSLSLFSTVLSSSRLSALHENRENPEAWFAFCIDGNRRPIPASRFVFRPKRAARGVPGVFQGWNQNWNLFLCGALQLFFQSCNLRKDSTWRDATKALTELKVLSLLLLFIFSFLLQG